MIELSEAKTSVSSNQSYNVQNLSSGITLSSYNPKTNIGQQYEVIDYSQYSEPEELKGVDDILNNPELAKRNAEISVKKKEITTEKERLIEWYRMHVTNEEQFLAIEEALNSIDEGLEQERFDEVLAFLQQYQAYQQQYDKVYGILNDPENDSTHSILMIYSQLNQYNEYLSDETKQKMQQYIEEYQRISSELDVEGARDFYDKVIDFRKSYTKELQDAMEKQYQATKPKTEKYTFGDALLDTVISYGASAENMALSFGKGVLKFGESVSDTGAMGLAALATPFTSAYDMISGDSVTKDMWNATKANVSVDVTGELCDYIDEWSGAREFWDQYAYDWGKSTGVGCTVAEGAGYITGVIVVNTVTFGGAGAATAAAGAGGGLSSAATAGLIAGFAGTGKNTEAAWNNGAGITEGLKYGIAKGAYEGAEMWLGYKINASKLISGTGFGSAVGNSLTHVAFDAADAASGALIDPYLSTLYDPSQARKDELLYNLNYDKDGNQINDLEWDDLSTWNKYQANFKANGGWKNVGTQALTGAAVSFVSELPEIATSFNTNRLMDSINTKGLTEQNIKSLGKLDNKSLKNFIEIAQNEGNLNEIFSNLSVEQCVKSFSLFDKREMVDILNSLDGNNIHRIMAEAPELFISGAGAEYINSLVSDMPKMEPEFNTVKANPWDMPTEDLGIKKSWDVATEPLPYPNKINPYDVATPTMPGKAANSWNVPTEPLPYPNKINPYDVATPTMPGKAVNSWDVPTADLPNKPFNSHEVPTEKLWVDSKNTIDSGTTTSQTMAKEVSTSYEVPTEKLWNDTGNATTLDLWNAPTPIMSKEAVNYWNVATAPLPNSAIDPNYGGVTVNKPSVPPVYGATVSTKTAAAGIATAGGGMALYKGVNVLELDPRQISDYINQEIKQLDPFDKNFQYKVQLLKQKETLEIELAERLKTQNSAAPTRSLDMLDASTQQEVKAKAQQIYDAAIAREPEVTNVMKSLTDENAKLEGLEFNIKSLSSTEEKVARNVLNDPTNFSVNDSLRYTLIVDGAYENTVLTKLGMLEAEGYTIVNMWNAWDYSTYKGLNVTLSKDGMQIELQFHTKNSFDAKQVVNHEFYEISRNTSLSKDIREISNDIQEINQKLYVGDGTKFSYDNPLELREAAVAKYEVLRKYEYDYSNAQKFSLNAGEAEKELKEIFGDGGYKLTEELLYNDKTITGILNKYEGTPEYDKIIDFLNNTKEGQYLKSLTEDELQAIRKYSLDPSINGPLRKGVIPEWERGYIESLNSALRKFGGVDTNLQLYRGIGIGSLAKANGGEFGALFEGINESNPQQVYAVLRNLEGQQIVDGGYLSTSPSYQHSFAKMHDRPIVMDILAESGTPGAYINQMSAYYNQENEFLLAAGTRIEIIKVEAPQIINGQEKVIVKCRVVN